MATSALEHPSITYHQLLSNISNFDHTPCYCEENVYRLCRKLITIGGSSEDGSDLFVVFISNDRKQVPLWCQKASKQADGLVIWDYHVICIQEIPNSWSKVQRNGEGKVPLQVWDLDSTLPFPSTLAQYVLEAIRPSFQIYPAYQRCFRVVHAPIFLRNFASDRRHMKDSAGSWISQPPAYEPIAAEDGSVHNLDEYMTISAAEVKNISDDTRDKLVSERLGVVVGEGDLENLLQLFSPQC